MTDAGRGASVAVGIPSGDAAMIRPASQVRLTPREWDVLQALLDRTINEAADHLGVTEHTVHHHLTAVAAKLGVLGSGGGGNTLRAAYRAIGWLRAPAEERARPQVLVEMLPPRKRGAA